MSGAGAVAHSVAIDHLTGANVVIGSTGLVEEVADYYSYGEIRIDEKTGFDEQRNMPGRNWILIQV